MKPIQVYNQTTQKLPTWAKGVIALGVTAGAIWLMVKGYKKIKEIIALNKLEIKEGGNTAVQASENFTNIPLIIGNVAKLTPSKDAYVVMVTNPTNKKVFEFDFYSNGRVIITPKPLANERSKPQALIKGKYFNSGKIITLDNGKSYQYNSVWTNMQEVLKNI
jgi:hypothetical protein